MKKSIAIVLSLALALVLSSAIITVSADFSPSVEFKDAPTVVTPENEDENVGAVIVGPDSEKIPVDKEDIKIVALSEAIAYVEGEDSKDPEDADYFAACNKLVSAYKNVVENGIASEVAGVKEAASALGFEEPKISVIYMFDASSADAHEDKLEEAGAYITISFTNDMLVGDDNFMVAHLDGDEWKMVDPQSITVEEDRIVINFEGLGPVMFMSVEEAQDDTDTESTPAGSESESDNETDETESDETETNDGGDDKDDDGSQTILIVVICVVAVAAVGVVVFVVLKKKGLIKKADK